MDNLLLYIVIALVHGIIFGLVTDGIGEDKGHKGCFWWGFWLGIIGVIVVACIPNKTKHNNTIKPIPKTKPAVSVRDKLTELKELQDSGLITEEDYEASKQNILSKL